MTGRDDVATTDPGPAGYAAATVAYALWGLLPMYWQVLGPAAAVEILAHRIAWTFALMLVVLTVVRRWDALRGLPATTWLQITAASVFIAVNWGTFIWAANHGRVVESALGYYIQPLFVVLLGVVVLGERLRGPQWAALGLAAVAVVVLAAAAGTVPWVSLVLAGAFALYGLLKKTVRLDVVPGLTAEGFLLGPLSIAFLVVLELQGVGTFPHEGAGHSLLLVLTGPATAIPLLLFALAARRLTLTALGVLQYLNPTLQFLVGVVVEGEPMPTSRWVGFALVWLALLLFSVDAVRSRRSAARRPVRSGTSCPGGGLSPGGSPAGSPAGSSTPPTSVR